MQFGRLDAFLCFDLRADPICREVGATDEHEGEEERDGPGENQPEHHPVDNTEQGSGLAREDSSVQENKASFDKAKGRDL